MVICHREEYSGNPPAFLAFVPDSPPWLPYQLTFRTIPCILAPGPQPGASLLPGSQPWYVRYPCCFWQVLGHHAVRLCRGFSFFQVHVLCPSNLPATQCDGVRTWPPRCSASFNSVGPNESSLLHSGHLTSATFQSLIIATSWTIPSTVGSK